MQWYWWCVIAPVFICLMIAIISFVCFYKVFYSPKRKILGADEFEIPEGEIYEVYREDMINWMKDIRQRPHEEFSIKSFDGLTLRANYYEYEPGAITEILFHGYKGNAERDLSGAVERCFALGRNALIVDHRASGKSEGHVISFGVNEHKDCLRWMNFALEHFGKDTKLILTGISMGAATVMMAAGTKLPENVICILADCGYSSQKEIIEKVITDMKLPAKLLYPFVKLGAKLFGRFDLEETTPMEAMKKCAVPIIFVHGDDDAFVPHYMSVKLFEMCVCDKKHLITIKGAGHGLAFPSDKEGYLSELAKIEKLWGFKK